MEELIKVKINLGNEFEDLELNIKKSKFGVLGTNKEFVTVSISIGK